MDVLYDKLQSDINECTILIKYAPINFNKYSQYKHIYARQVTVIVQKCSWFKICITIIDYFFITLCFIKLQFLYL